MTRFVQLPQHDSASTASRSIRGNTFSDDASPPITNWKPAVRTKALLGLRLYSGTWRTEVWQTNRLSKHGRPDTSRVGSFALFGFRNPRSRFSGTW
jgi:hypothetical protein